MGCWGMGITQSDEFCEVYDRFLEEYDQGKTVVEITEKILSEYRFLPPYRHVPIL